MGKLGDTLRERRTALGLSIEAVEEGTRIRARLIEAIEEGHYDRLPNPGYVRGYVSSYARFLELDPVPLLNMYKAETGVGRVHEINLPQTAVAVVPRGQQHAVPWRAAVTIAVTVALLSLGVWAGIRFWSGPEPTRPEPSNVVETTEEPTASAEETTPTVEETPEPEPEPEMKPFTLLVRVSNEGASWLKITVDDQDAYEGVLAAGQSKEYEVAKGASVRIGKPEAVTVLKDGKEVDIKQSEGIGKVTLSAMSSDEQ